MATTKQIGIDWYGLSARPTKQYTSDALVAAAQVAASSCNLCGFIASNNNAAVRYLQIHNSATTPAEGAVPMASLPIAAGDTLVMADMPLTLSAGLYICLSETLATKTLADADLNLLAYYRQ